MKKLLLLLPLAFILTGCQSYNIDLNSTNIAEKKKCEDANIHWYISENNGLLYCK